MAKARLRFGVAKSGWLPVLLSIDGVEHEFQASHLPSDFLADLASALDAFLGLGRGAAVLHEEPKAQRWSLVGRDGEGELRVLEYDSFRAATQADDQGKQLVRVSMPVRDLALSLWRGLRTLEGAKDTLLDPKEWPHPFPSKLLDQAGRRLGR